MRFAWLVASFLLAAVPGAGCSRPAPKPDIQTAEAAAPAPPPLPEPPPPPPPPPPAQVDPPPPPPPPPSVPVVTPTATAKQGESCLNGVKCDQGLTCVEYYGFAGPRGPMMATCEIPCPTKKCPKGQHCTTISDGPGRVCQPD